MFQNVIVGWLARRGLELGGIAAAVIAWYIALPLVQQDAINRIFTGGWREVPIGIYLGLGAAAWGYVWSFMSTVKPQVVTADKQQIPIKPNTHAASKIEAQAAAAPKPKTLWERITQR